MGSGSSGFLWARSGAFAGESSLALDREASDIYFHACGGRANGLVGVADLGLLPEVLGEAIRK